MNETVEMKLYLYEKEWFGGFNLCAFSVEMLDMPEYLYLASKSVTFELPSQKERTERKIVILQKKLAERRAADHKAQTEISDAIQRLLCIEAPK